MEIEQSARSTARSALVKIIRSYIFWRIDSLSFISLSYHYFPRSNISSFRNNRYITYMQCVKIISKTRYNFYTHVSATVALELKLIPCPMLKFLKKKKRERQVQWQLFRRLTASRNVFVSKIRTYVHIYTYTATFFESGRFAAQQRQWPRNKSDSNYTERLVLADATRSAGWENKKKNSGRSRKIRGRVAGKRILNPARPIFRLVPVKGWLSRLFHSDAAKYRAAQPADIPARATKIYPGHPPRRCKSTYEPH